MVGMVSVRFWKWCHANLDYAIYPLSLASQESGCKLKHLQIYLQRHPNILGMVRNRMVNF